MAVTYLVTGAAGHLGGAVVRLLAQRGERVRALVLPADAGAPHLLGRAELFTGDVTQKETLRPFFAEDGTEHIVIHCAGLISIASHYDARVCNVNVNGTRNITELCSAYRVKRLVYVSSVHALPVLPNGAVQREISQFDPQLVHGLYAKTKAEATACVLRAAQNGLDACVVHPSGICGPWDPGCGHLTQLLLDYCRGSLVAGVPGGYDFVDVRDVAAGILACCSKGRSGECYLLSGRYCSVPELLELFHSVTGLPRVKTLLPLWLAKATAPLSEAYYHLLHQKPLYTAYSLETLSSNALFSHEKAAKELDFTPRPLAESVRDAYDWLCGENRIAPPAARRGGHRSKQPASRASCAKAASLRKAPPAAPGRRLLSV